MLYAQVDDKGGGRGESHTRRCERLESGMGARGDVWDMWLGEGGGRGGGSCHKDLLLCDPMQSASLPAGQVAHNLFCQHASGHLGDVGQL